MKHTKKGFVIEHGEGDYTAETDDYEDAEPSTDFVNIGKAKITSYCELSDEAAKLPDTIYQGMVRDNMQIAIRKKIAKQIIVGLGGANQITGIFKAPVNVIPLESNIEISVIDAETMDKMVFGYGRSENVEGGAYLFLNKEYLAAFASLRDGLGKRVYNITLDKNGNTGTISSDSSYAVSYIINIACACTYCMAYGKPAAYEMPYF
ncbi:MAG: phage major capsid protein [Candidatus Pristimantibacillus lignocellulolyticus]|uniref:Phage major capsid protein n=1 Tax=Candidatus Pristimantibacillus lignocellulolyticus TaxID=2994561 RepID=A0A9J6ZKL2_9BACL|nr:MAG: phage major capsid protein [Candidatus Pristimantibacillus lignocellulolyticus]